MKVIKADNIIRQIKPTDHLTFYSSAILLTIISITIVHYVTLQEEIILHVIYRELYFIPIIFAGFWFGLKGGLITSLLVSTFYLPIVIGIPNDFNGHKFGDLSQILIFNVIGFLVGWLQERELHRQTIKSKEDGLIKIGKAVSCIAHDMKTPLVAIGGFTRQIRRTLVDNENIQKKLDIVLKQTQRLESMVQDMLNFSKPLELDCKQNCINSLFDETSLIAGEKARAHNVHISFQLDNDLPFYSFDYYRLQQALLNLINNAIEASPDGGKVYIRCRYNNKRISIEIEDSGKGLMGQSKDEILEPFFTSKKEGTGLGLPIVKKIIEAHAGVLEYEQKVDQGMVFRVIFEESDSYEKLAHPKPLF